jgi:3-(3-hydroxy-phenyl)propionate hydroxylase
MDATDAATAISRALTEPDATTAAKHIARCAKDRRTWGVRNRNVSPRGLRMLRGESRYLKVAQPLAARIAPAFWPAGVWLADAPIQSRPPKVAPFGWY